MTVDNVEYELRPIAVTGKEISETVKLLRVVWPEAQHFTERYIEWLYVDNPTGTAIGANAWWRGALIGHYAVIPIEVKLRDKRVKAALSLNTAVHPEHQGRGLFTRLARVTYVAAKEAGFNHIVGVANANSTPGFVQKLGFKVIAPLKAKIVWGNPTLANLVNNDESSDWERMWSLESYSWRMRQPGALYEVSKNKSYSEWLAPTNKYGICALMKLEDNSDFARLLESSFKFNRCRWFKLWIGLSQKVAIPTAGAWNIPWFLRRSPLNLIFLSLIDSDFVPSASRVEFSLLDFDAY